MKSFVWIGLALLVACSSGGVAFVAVRGVSAYRSVRSAGGELTAATERLARDADELARKLDPLAEASARLEAALTRLRASRARLNVLLKAVAQVRAAITGLVPKKV